MKYSVKTIRHAGLEARWTRTRNGAPIMVTRNPNSEFKHQRERWWYVDKPMWDDMSSVGVAEAFDRHTLLGDIFCL